MAGKAAILTVKILSDAKGAQKGLDAASGKVDKFRAGVSKLAIPAAATAAALGALGKSAVDSASRQQQAFGALEAVFGKNAKTVEAWAMAASDAVGLSASEYAEFASVVGAQLKNLGVPADQVLGKTKDLISLGADLAATYGGTTADAVGALSAALRGEADPAERYGLALNQTAVNARLAEKGMSKLQGSALTAAKAQTILELATEQAGGAIGQFGRESDTLSGQQQRLSATWENAQAALGRALLPAVTAVTKAFGQLAGMLGKNAAATSVVLGVIAALAVGILALNGAFKLYTATTAAMTAAQTALQGSMLATRVGLAALAVQEKVVAAASKAWAAAQWLVNAALAGNPIVLVVAAIVALIAVIVVLWNKCAWFRDAVTGAFKAMARVATVAWDAIKKAAVAVFNFLKPFINGVIKAITLYIKVYAAIFKVVFYALRAVAIIVWAAIRAYITAVTRTITAVVRSVSGPIRAVWNAVRTTASVAWSAIRALVSAAMTAVKASVNAIKAPIAAVWNAIKSAASTAWGALAGIVEAALRPIKGIIDGIADAFQWVIDKANQLAAALSKIKAPSIKIPGIGKLFGASAPAPSSSSVAGSSNTSPSLRGLGATGTAAAGGRGGVTYVINVNGIVDGTDGARKIRRVLREDERRRGGVLVGNDYTRRRTT